MAFNNGAVSSFGTEYSLINSIHFSAPIISCSILLSSSLRLVICCSSSICSFWYLLDNITKFLMELGKGFAFVGREYTIPIEGTEEKIDLLFYHLYLHCYVVVEVKIVAFTSRDIGQIGTYVNIVDDLVKTDFDAKTIGLIICKSKNNILAKYAVNSSKEPIGISEYKLSNLLPVEYRASMPTIEEIENELR